MFRVGKLELFAIALVLIIIGPVVTIWALNTLFPSLGIPLTLSTWTAVLVLKGSGVALNMGRK